MADANYRVIHREDDSFRGSGNRPGTLPQMAVGFVTEAEASAWIAQDKQLWEAADPFRTPDGRTARGMPGRTDISGWCGRCGGPSSDDSQGQSRRSAANTAARRASRRAPKMAVHAGEPLKPTGPIKALPSSRIIFHPPGPVLASLWTPTVPSGRPAGGMEVGPDVVALHRAVPHFA